MMDQLGNLATQAFWILFILGLCIYSHELGHFLAAKLSRMHVREFAFGLGPVLFGKKWGETLYSVRAVPFGGLNDIAGMEPGEQDVPGGFHTRPRWQRMMTIFAGVFMNVVLAMVLFWIIAVFHGVSIPDSRIAVVRKVMAGEPAEAAGLQPGDEIVGIDGNRHNLVVATVEPDSVAERAGIGPGYFILAANGQDIAVPGQLVQILSQTEDDQVWIGAVDLDAATLTDSVTTARLPRLDIRGEITPDLRAAPEVKAGVSMWPLRRAFEETGGVVHWFADEKRVRAVNQELDISLEIGDPLATVNNQQHELILAPYIKRGRTMVPRQFLANTVAVAITPKRALELAHQQLGLSFEPLDQAGAIRYLSLQPNAKIAVTVRRQGRELTLAVHSGEVWGRLETITAGGQLDSPHRKTGRIGVLLGTPTRRAGLLEGLAIGAGQSAGSVVMVVQAVRAMIAKKIVAEGAGPIGIMAMTAERAAAGWAAVLSLCGIISANLAVINLFPIPPFDGFHIVLLSYEGIIRRRISARPETIIRMAGIFLIMLLFVWLVAKDVSNLLLYGTP